MANIYGTKGNDDLNGTSGNDRIDGDKGNDTLKGGAGNDFLYGGRGDDEIIAGDGNDFVDGGDGDDTIIGGGDNDNLNGGDGADRFVITLGSSGVNNTTVNGNRGGHDNDVLDISGLLKDGYAITNLVKNPDDNGFNGQIQLYNSTTNQWANINFSDIEEIVICFTPGTLITTPMGEIPVERLQVGERVITRDNGVQRIAWVGRKLLDGGMLRRQPALNPVLIRKGSLGMGLPERDMRVSPNHRMLTASDQAALYFEEREVLVAAKDLCHFDGVDQVEAPAVEYIHIMFERHEVILGDGAWTESFQPGHYSMRGLDAAQRAEILEIFPELADLSALQGIQSARRSLRRFEAALLRP
ncbi:Hemolysin-type calcium-binding repeat-containing protein [Palleronia marisminoris]|uniref:Hemolysin, chromosomal n=1 Tax=Palleronia marisminoris TaxID=315423 RepID=A0A1Y5RH12_9RHOB|nr:Hint domain-containing protein [Palleronia marisminoris]SFG16729.1 Hemolysin-type calcium-binding repeat-containing protein [Palleronia marisminoris]SLN16426.1 Hemolysin, chromosomal [Palleronia marisminoris]